MIPFEKAYQLVLESRDRLETEEVPLDEACGLVLADPLFSDMDMPPFPKSAMDGYACRKEDLPGPLEVIETIAAGCWPQRSLGAGQCAKIMTGAPVPEGADCVIMVEYCQSAGEKHILFNVAKTANNICYQGEDLRQGQEVLAAGTLLAPQHIAVLASVGCARPRLIRRARVGVLATGNELVAPDARPSKAQIRNSNSPQLCAQIQALGAVAKDYGIVRDLREDLDATLGLALEENDLVLVSGGVSMGDYDLVPAAMQANGLRILFDRVAIKPGKPSTYAVREDACCFGLPGNPVSTFIQFKILVAPLILKLMGRATDPSTVQSAPLAHDYSRKKTDRSVCLPVQFQEDGSLLLCSYHGSAHIHALCDADGFIQIPQGVATLCAGDLVHVRRL